MNRRAFIGLTSLLALTVATLAAVGVLNRPGAVASGACCDVCTSCADCPNCECCDHAAVCCESREAATVVPAGAPGDVKVCSAGVN